MEAMPVPVMNAVPVPVSCFFTLKTLNFVVKTAKILNFSRLRRLLAPQANIFTCIQQFSNKKRLSLILSKNPNISRAPSGSVIYLIALQIKNISLGKPNLPPTRVTSFTFLTPLRNQIMFKNSVLLQFTVLLRQKILDPPLCIV